MTVQAPARLSEPDHQRRFAAEVDLVLDHAMARGYTRYCSANAWQPNVNVYEIREAIVVCVDLAAVNLDDLGVEVAGGRLVIRGRRSPAVPTSVAGPLAVHVMEIDAGTFARQIELPAPARRDGVALRYVDGLLEIVVRKDLPAARPESAAEQGPAGDPRQR